MVVVPVLDEARCIDALVERLLHGDHTEFARRDPADRADLVVVVDGGSSDGGQEHARAAGAVVIDAPRGRGAQLAAGAEWAVQQEGAADEDLLFFVHADNTPADGALAALRRAADEATGTSVVAWGCRQAVDAQGPFYRAVENLADKRVAQRGLVYGDSSLCLTAKSYRAAGGFRALPLFEDVDISRRLRKLGRVALVPDAAIHVSARRWKREGATVTVIRNWILTKAYWLGVPPFLLAKLYPRHRSDAAKT